MRPAVAVSATCLAVIGLLLASVHSQGTTNMLANPGFELDANNDGRPDGWTSHTAFRRTAVSVRTGGYAGAHIRTDNGGHTIYQQVAATAGQIYALNGWVHVPATADAFTYTLVVEWRGRSGKLTSTTIQKLTAATAGWVEAGRSLTAPAGTTAARVIMKVSSLRATIYVDDLSFGIAGAPSPSPSPSAEPVSSVSPTPSPSPSGEPVNSVSPTPTPTPSSVTESPATPTPSPTPSADPVSSASPTPSPTPSADPVSPSPSLDPGAEPTPPPHQPAQALAGSCDTLRGYGSGVTGGTTPVLVDTFAEVESALEVSGNRVVIEGSGVLDGNGAKLEPASNTTLTRAPGSTAVLSDTWIVVKGVTNVLLDDFVIRTGDESVDDAGNADPISIMSSPGVTTRGIAVNRVEAIFGPDVGGVTILTNGTGAVTTDVTVQCSILGLGLYRSAHPEAGDLDGHSYAINISGTGGSDNWPTRITLAGNLIIGSESRNPRVCGADSVDVVNNLVYGYREAASCNPRGMNYVNNVLREGPHPEGVGLEERGFVFRPKTSAEFPVQFAESVYEAGNVCDAADGTACARGTPLTVYRTSTYGTLSVTPAPAAEVFDRVLAVAGPTTRDALTARWIGDVQNRTGEYWNGHAGPSPSYPGSAP